MMALHIAQWENPYIGMHVINIKTHGSEVCVWEITPQLKHSSHNCELFTCRDGFTISGMNYVFLLNKIVQQAWASNRFFRRCSSLLQPQLAYLDIIHLVSCLIVKLSSRYTTQHTCVCAAYLTLTLSGIEFPLCGFSLFKPLIQTITFTDTTWTQGQLANKQVVNALRV